MKGNDADEVKMVHETKFNGNDNAWREIKMPLHDTKWNAMRLRVYAVK